MTVKFKQSYSSGKLKYLIHICKGWTQTDYQNKHYNINQNEEET